MRAFLLRLVFYFLWFFSVCFIGFTGLFMYVRDNCALHLKASYLVMGNSHPECALDDRQSSFFLNLAKSAEPVYYTQFKLAKMLDWNPHLKKVFVELSENQFEYRMQEWIWSRQAVQRHLNELLFYLPFEFHCSALKHLGLPYIFDFIYAIKVNLEGLMLSQGDNFFQLIQWGGFTPKKGTFLEKQNKSEWSRLDEELNPYPENIQAIFNMVNVCKSKGVEIQFIRCPVHPTLSQHFENAYQKIIQDNEEIELLDFRNFPLPDEFFFDDQHLNELGAKRFTQHFITILEQKN
ncbi:MAG: hypothetical protein RLY35_220 [Bacteroidota bacterium]|jgi:hypothetical protein